MNYALIHDADEAITGDVPPSLNKIKSEKERIYGSSLTRRIVKTADILEAWLFLTEDKAMGNDVVYPIIEQLAGRVKPWAASLGFKNHTRLLTCARKEFNIYDAPALEKSDG